MQNNERPQDPSSALEQTMHYVSNLPSEFKYIFEEIKNADTVFIDYKKRYLTKDSQLHKFIKQHGSLTENPKELEINKKIQEEMDKCLETQQAKCVLANTALYLAAKHLEKIKYNINALEEDGLLAPLGEEFLEDKEAPLADLSREGSSVPSSRKRPVSSSSSGPVTQKKRQKKERSKSQLKTGSRDQTPGVIAENFDGFDYNDELFQPNQGEEDDKQLYCFCKSVSYGEMVACDGPHCKYEWFHYSCVNLTEPPKGQWYCPDCRQEMANQKLKKKKK